ncbi:hypothetical protein, partial [Chitinimonas sp.]|uniref:hypothetical protein n=1 Tax=Chitinimonas sp. TaxID=1934313 RepID=UPI0035B0A4FA
SDRQALSEARQLARAGRLEEAARAMRRLFPAGPPEGPLLLEYYRVLAGTESGRAQALAGYARLVKAYPQEPEFRTRLAALQLQRSDSRQQAIRTLAAMARLRQGNVQEVMALWRRALLSSDAASSDPQLFKAFLQLDPKDSAVAEQLVKVMAARAERSRRAHDPDEIRLATLQQQLADDQLDVAADAIAQLAGSKLADDGRRIGAQGFLAIKRGEPGAAEALFRR